MNDTTHATPEAPLDSLPADAVVPNVALLEAELASWKDKAYRAAAELENGRKRQAAELAEARQYAVQKFAADLLGVGDNLARALSAPEGNEKALREGVALTATQMATTLGRHGVQEVPVKAGAPLDANTMQAMNEVPHAEIAAGHVVQALQAGFTLHGRLLRPALVVVSGGSALDEATETVGRA